MSVDVKAAMQKKIGPLPVWSVVAVLGGAVVIFFVRRGSGASRAKDGGLTDVGQPGGGFPEYGPEDYPAADVPGSTTASLTPSSSANPIAAAVDAVTAPAKKVIVQTRPTAQPTINSNPWGVTNFDLSKTPIVETATGPAYAFAEKGGATGMIPTNAVIAKMPGSDVPISLSDYAVRNLGLTRGAPTALVPQK